MPESFVPVWLSIGEIQTALRWDVEDARCCLPGHLRESFEDALEDERPRTFEEMEAERKAHQLGEPFVDHKAIDISVPGRVPPRECIRAARDALNKMYSTEGPVEKLWMFMAEALDWQRRALEQIAEPDA